ACDAAASCAANSDCPSDFCQPFSSRADAIADRDSKSAKIISMVNGISPKAGPLFDTYLKGGTDKRQDLSASAAQDFTNDPATVRAAEYLRDALKAKAPPEGQDKTVDIKKEIPEAIAEIGKSRGPNQLEYVTPPGLPGLIAGGIGENQAACRVGAKP